MNSKREAVQAAKWRWTLALTLGLATGVANAEPPRAVVGIKIKPITVGKESFKPLPGKQPIPFKAFPLLDPETGKPISADKEITLPNGKKMAAGKFYELLNEHEAALNKFGRSLKENGDKLGTVAAIPVDQARLLEAREAMVREHAVAAVPQVFTPRAFIVPPGHGPIGGIQVCYGELNYSKPYSRSIGGNTFGAEITASIQGKAQCNSLETTAEGVAYGTLFSRYELARGYAHAITPRTGAASLQIRLNTLGKEIYRKDFSETNLTRNDSYNYPFDESGEFHATIGPIPVTVSYGVAGNVGMNWGFSVAGTRIQGQSVPKLQSHAYLQGGIDAVVAEAGVGGQMTLLNDTMTAQAVVEVASKDNKSQFHVKASLYNQLEALAGRLYGYVKVYVPRWGIPPWTKKEYDKDFFNWSGVTASGSLFAFDQWTPVGTTPVVHP